MDKEIIAFRDIGVEKRKFNHRKNLILMEDKDLSSMDVSKDSCLVAV